MKEEAVTEDREPLFNEEKTKALIEYVNLPCHDLGHLMSGLKGATFFRNRNQNEGKKEQQYSDIVSYIEKNKEALVRSILLIETEERIEHIDQSLIPTIKLALYSLFEKQENIKKDLERSNDRERKFAPIFAPFERLKAETVLVGEYLPRLYESSFKVQWGISRPSGGGEPYGPGIRFIQKAMYDMGVNIKPESIYWAYRTMKKKNKESSDAEKLFPNWREDY